VRGRERIRWAVSGSIAISMLLILGACSSNSASGGSGGAEQPPTANMPVAQSIGAGEGQLNLIAWEGYAQPLWVKPFEDQTGCTVHAKYDGTSNAMVADMADGGGGQYDLVSASGDA